MTHLDDPTLEHLACGSLVEDDANAARRHLEDCAACARRAERLQTLSTSFAGLKAPSHPGRAAAVARRALTPSPSTSRPWAPLLASTLAAAVAVVAFLPRAPDGADVDITQQTFVARGASDHADVSFDILSAPRSDDDGPAVVRPGTPLPPKRPLSLSARLLVSPADEDRFVAVFAQDSRGRVTWLLPSWTQGPAPACVPLPRQASVLTPDEGVTFDASPGAIRFGLLRSPMPCTIAAFDDALERRLPPPSPAVVVDSWSTGGSDAL